MLCSKFNWLGMRSNLEVNEWFKSLEKCFLRLGKVTPELFIKNKNGYKIEFLCHLRMWWIFYDLLDAHVTVTVTD